MDTPPPIVARAAALIFAFLNLSGLLFFGDYYFSAEHRADLLIYALPTLALIAGGAAPSAWYRVQPTKSLIAILLLASMPALCVAIYRDITLINGADWPAAILRSLELALLITFARATSMSTRQPA